MKFRGVRVAQVGAVTIALILALLIVLLNGSSHPKQVVTHASSKHSKASTTTSTGKEVTPRSPTTAPSVSAPATTLPTYVVTATELQQLQQQMATFVGTFYLIKPGDTVATRQARVAKLAPASVLKLQDLTLTTSQTAAAAAGLTQTATIVKSASSVAMNGDPTHQYLISLVKTSYQSATGAVVSAAEVSVAAIWHFDAGVWTLMSFSQGGNS